MSLFYGIPDDNSYIKQAVARLSLDDVNAPLRNHLRTDCIQFVAITDNAAALAMQLAGTGPTSITYNSVKPKEVLDEDKLVERWDLGLRPEDISIVSADTVFE